MSVSAISSASSSYWEKLLQQMNGSSGSESQDSLSSKLFGDLDSDGDGTLSLDETGLSSELYNNLDTDGDGAVSQTELQKAIETQRNAMFTSMQLGQSQGDAQATSTTQPSAQDMLSALLSGKMPAGTPGAAQGGSDDLASQLFSSLDSDGNGSLSTEESGLSQSVYDAMDTDQDGSVSADELAAALQKQREALGLNAQASQLQPDTQNASGTMSAKDLLSSIMNGQMPSPPPQQGQAASSAQNGTGMASSLFSALNTDNSDGLSMEETGLSQSAYDAMDTDQDGSVSADELAAALEKQRAALGMNQDATTRSSMARNFLSAIASSAYQAVSQTGAVSQTLTTVA